MEMAGRGRARVRVFLRAKRVRFLPALFLDFEQRPDFPHDALTPLQGALGAERAPGFQHLLLDLLGLRGRPLDEARELVHALVEEREHGNGAVDPLVQVLVREVGVFVAQEDTQLDIRVPLDHPGEHRDVVEGVAAPVLREDEDLELRAQPVERCAVLRLDFDLAQELDELFLVRPHLVQVLLECHALREPLLRDHGSPLRLASDGGAPVTGSPRLRLRLALRPRDVLRLARPRHRLAPDGGGPAPRRPAGPPRPSSHPGGVESWSGAWGFGGWCGRAAGRAARRSRWNGVSTVMLSPAAFATRHSASNVSTVTERAPMRSASSRSPGVSANDAARADGPRSSAPRNAATASPARLTGSGRPRPG